jgi:hypothetical protein
VDHGALVDGARAILDAVECGIEFFERDFGEESERAEIDAEDRNAGLGDGAGGGKQGAVAAEYDDELRDRPLNRSCGRAAN